MDVDTLLKALDDTSNEGLLNLTTKKIQDMNERVLRELGLTEKETMDYKRKLAHYKYVDEMNDLKYGAFLRWIPLEDADNIHLTKGALFCEMRITPSGVYLACRNFGYHSNHFLVAMDKNLIFQKLTRQELVLLSALDHLSQGNT